MEVGEARRLAKEWFLAEADHTPELHGVFMYGSVLAMHEQAPMPETSDVDAVFIVPDDVLDKTSQQRITYRGLQLSGLVFSLIDEVAFSIKGSSGSIPPMELFEEIPHDDDHGFLSGHGDPLSVIEFTVETFASYQGQHDLTEDFA